MKIAYPLMAVVALAALAGCGSSVASYCDDRCECEGCSDSELADCVDRLDDLERSAEREGCEDRWDEYFACSNDEFECRPGGVVDDDGCEAEFAALVRCLA